MKFGIMTGSGFDPSPTLAGLTDNALRIEKLGFDSLWMANIYSHDALTALSVIGSATERIELGTAVVSSHSRHPMSMAQQALTASAASGGRFTLGIGLSHRYVIEEQMGLSYDRPAAHMREYLAVLKPLLESGSVNVTGELYSSHVELDVPGTTSPSLIIAALGPAMLKLAGTETDGTSLWLTGPRTIASHTAPTIARAASAAGRPAPRIIAGMPVVLSKQPALARSMVDRQLEPYRTIPSYRAMLDREGARGPGDIALVGDADDLREQFAALSDIGVTDLNAVIVNEDPDTYEATLEFLAGELGRARN